jgi:hypothetical protein
MVKEAISQRSPEQPSREEEAPAGRGSAPVAVLVLTALAELRDGSRFPYHQGVFPGERGPLTRFRAVSPGGSAAVPVPC